MTQQAPSWWPEGKDLTTADDRQPDRFEVDYYKARRELVKELERIKAADIRLDETHGSDGFPGVAVSWTRHGRPYRLACDTYRSKTQNFRACGLTVAKLRHVREYGAVTTEEAYQGLEALPSTVGRGRAMPMPGSQGATDGKAQAPHLVLGVDPDASEDEIRNAARAMRLRWHPDKPGGSEERLKLVNRAAQELLEAAPDA